MPARHARSARPSADKVQSALLMTLGAMAFLRGAAALLPGHWLWSLDLFRWSSPWTWGLWLASALVLLPAVGEWIDRPVVALGDRLEHGWLAPLVCALLAAGLVLLFPDHLHYVGDSLIRADAVSEGLPARALTPQALPLDVWFHSTLPAALAHAGIDPTLATRLLGAVEAGALAALAIAFARTLGLSGGALVGSAAVVFWGGWLALDTGFGKAFAELVLAALALASLGISVVRGRRHLGFGAVLALTFLLHRSALGFIPAAIGVWLAGRVASGRGWRVWVGMALPMIAFVAIAPKLWQSLHSFDTTHFAAPGEGAGGAVARVLAPLRLLDLANLALFLIPLLPLLFVLSGRREKPGPLLEPDARRFLVLLTLPFLVALFFLRPAQGIARDFDDYSTGAMTVAVLVAARVGSRLRDVRRAGWMAGAIALGCAAPIVAWLALESDVTLGLARVEAWIAGPPLRTEAERATTYDFLGGRWFRAGRYDLAESELEHAAQLTPSPRLVLGWASAAERAHDFATAERAYRLLLERADLMDSTGVRVRAIAMGGIAVSAARRGDLAEARRWAEQAVQESPGDPGPEALLQRILAAQADTTGNPGPPSNPK
jgi:hypothetical protein